MKKLILIFALIFISGVLATAQDSALWRYVNTLDGVNVRDKPSLSGKKKFALKCNERVQLIEETAEKETIGEFEEPWCKIRTQDGSWGFVYGAYLSKSLASAAYFRCYEALHPVADYLEGLADEFASEMNIENNMRNISSFNEEDTNRVYGQGMNFIFYPTKDNESGKEGYFLLGVYVFDNGSLPKDFPIRLGDSLEKVYEIFGKEPNGERYYLDDGEEIKAWEGWGNICHVEMLVFHNGESVMGIKFIFAPGW